jgi:hypothetical protein
MGAEGGATGSQNGALSGISGFRVILNPWLVQVSVTGDHKKVTATLF